MIKASVRLLKNNPVIIAFYAAFTLFSSLLMLLLMPREFSSNDPAVALTEFAKMLVWMIITGIMGLLFISGFGNMLAQTVITTRASISHFTQGIKKFSFNILIVSLLLIAFFMVLLMIVAIALIPIYILMNSNLQADSGYISHSYSVNIIAVYLVIGILSPFIMLWYPCIFIDNAGPVESLKRSTREGTKSYWRLAPVFYTLSLPDFIYALLTNDQGSAGIWHTPWYWIIAILNSMFFLVVSVYLLQLYYYRSNSSSQNIPD